jgi:hypothetical protein
VGAMEVSKWHDIFFRSINKGDLVFGTLYAGDYFYPILYVVDSLKGGNFLGLSSLVSEEQLGEYTNTQNIGSHRRVERLNAYGEAVYKVNIPDVYSLGIDKFNNYDYMKKCHKTQKGFEVIGQSVAPGDLVVVFEVRYVKTYIYYGILIGNDAVFTQDEKVCINPYYKIVNKTSMEVNIQDEIIKRYMNRTFHELVGKV